jgi:hypothetical protein
MKLPAAAAVGDKQRMHRSFLAVASLLLFLTLSPAAEPPAISMRPMPAGIGINIHFTKGKSGELDEMEAAGIRWIRTDLNWAGTERAKGVYNFSVFDGLLKDLEAHHIAAWFILDYGNPLYDKDSPHTDEDRTAFAAWAAAAVTHFAGHGIVWEMWNEPNIGFWKPKPNVDDYAKLARATGKAVHAADPSAVFVGPGCSQIDMKFLEACFKAGCLDDWSAVSVHPYRQSGPERAVAEYDGLRKLIATYAHGRSVPILSGEWGYSVAWKNFDDDRQADYLARQWLVNQWQQIPISIWYDWRDDGPDPKEAEHHFGIVRHAPTTRPGVPYDAKPAYAAAKTLTTVLNGYVCLGRVKTDRPDDYVLLFADGDKKILAVWTAAKTPQLIRIGATTGSFTATSMTGKPLPAVEATDVGLAITVGPEPVYLVPAVGNTSLSELRAEHP